VSIAEPQIRTGLDALFLPDCVALIGATERSGTVGRTILENLLHPSFRGKVFAVNSRHPEICGRKAYPSISDVPDKIELAIVATPAPTVPGIVGECVDAGVKSAVVISAGFKERGPQGVELERQIQEQLRRSSMRLIGPNCLGIMNPSVGLNATFAKDAPRPGNVAFLSWIGHSWRK
jgi:acetyltransferase